MKTSTRPYNSEEIDLLRSRKYSIWQQIEHFGIKWVVITLLLLTPFLLFEKYVHEVPPQIELPIVIVLQFISIVIVIYLMKRMGELSWNRFIEQEIKNGQVEITKIKTDRVFKRRDPEDFGPGFYIKIDDKKTLYLEGQYLDELQFAKSFPNTEFEIIRAISNKELLKINTFGKYLKPERKLKSFTKAQYKKDEYHSDGDIIELPLDEIK